MNSRARFPELDLLRFIAACSVMLFHFTYFAPQHHLLQLSYPVLSQIGKYGFLGVDIFFILSGFVILLTAYEKDAIAFTVARIVRLYPAYWICVTLTAVAIVVTRALPATVTRFQYFANLTMVQGFFGIRDVSGVYWTLAVEIQFYLLIFLVLLAGQVHRISYLLGLWLLASVVLALRAPHGIAHFFLFPEWSSYFIAGAMLFIIHREGPSAYKLLVVGACYMLSVAYAIKLLPFGAGPLEEDFSAPVIGTALAVAYGTFLFIALRTRSKSDSSPFYILGLITYPLYLLHQDIGYILLRLVPTGLNRLFLLCVVMSAMVGLAWLVHIGPEKWLALRLKSLLSRPQNAAKSLNSLISERLARSRLKQALSIIRTAVTPRVSPVPLTFQRSQPQMAEAQLVNPQKTSMSTAIPAPGGASPEAT